MEPGSENPYATPTTVSRGKRRNRFRNRLISSLLIGFAVVALIASLMSFRRGAEIANQESWHLWETNTIIHDYTINGVSVPLDRVAAFHFRDSAIAGALMLFFAVGAWWLSPRRNSFTGDDASSS